jgi:hypothetical protein
VVELRTRCRATPDAARGRGVAAVAEVCGAGRYSLGTATRGNAATGIDTAGIDTAAAGVSK